jgi:transposase
MATSKTFKPWEVDQTCLFPPSVRDFVPADHLASLVRELVRNELDLSAIHDRYSELRGFPPYHPTMMTALLLYALCRGVYSSRRIEASCEERVDFMAVTGRGTPDHSTICKFRNDHRQALSELFLQVLSLCRQAGLAKLGHVALDGTKVQANASKHSAMSYKRMKEAEPELAAKVEEWMAQAQAVDEAEDAEHGPGNRGDTIPSHIQAKIRKLAKIREAKALLEERAAKEAAKVAQEREEREQETGRRITGRAPKALAGVPEDKAQTNFTDPESRIMKTAKGFEQCYNAGAAVDAEHQVIVATTLSNKQNDHDDLVVLVDQTISNTGETPRQVSADAGYCSERNLEALEQRGVEGFVATGRQKHGTASPTKSATPKGERTVAMAKKLKEQGFESPYRLRKHTVEPVFGQIKECRGFRRFLHRGIEKVTGEWALLCTAHNVLKLVGARG